MKKVSLVVPVLLFSVSVVVTAVYILHAFFGYPSRYNEQDSGYNKAYWRGEISRHGAEESYASFLQRNSSVPEVRQHLFAHAMGEALFEELGIEAVIVCTDAFSFGCYHGFSSRAIATGGIEALLKLDAACTQKFGNLSGCKHGLGHGILEYVGYGKIERALSMCAELVSQPTPLLGCTSGVFMEYLSPLTDSFGGLESGSRMIDYAHPYAPCTEVAEEYQNSCYFELGQWFRQTPNTDYGGLCDALTGSRKEKCFLGIGTDMTRGWKDAATLIRQCARYSSENELACRAGAAWSLVGTQTAVQLCSYENTARSQKCIELADLTEGLDVSIRQALLHGTPPTVE